MRGKGTGNYTTIPGTEQANLAMPPFSQGADYTEYVVVVDFDVQSGIAAPWFNEPGGGVQYYTDLKIWELIDAGYIIRS